MTVFTERPLCVAIIGAGPAGFFAAAAMLKSVRALGLKVRVDIFDRLPAPYGLVRYGVAPDHQKIKSVTKTFAQTAADPDVRFFGGVNLGSDVTLDELRARYDQIMLSVGAPSDMRLGIAGEDAQGSYSATEFVAWYNGHPDYAARTFNLSAKAAVVVGAGNVALDVARVLAKSTAELAKSDIATHALRALEGSAVEDVYIIARRGPAQAKFTNVELKEFGELEVAAPVVRAEDFEIDPQSQAEMDADKTTRRNVEIMQGFASVDPAGRPRRVHFLFMTSPVEVLSEGGQVTGVKMVKNALRPNKDGVMQAVATDETWTLPAGLVLRSIGYKGVPVPGVPFHARWGTVLNEAGRVVDEGGQRVAGLYVAGWAKRGPSGVIGTNKSDAAETARCMVEDIDAITPISAELAADDAIPALLRGRGVRAISFDQWRAIEAEEDRRGAAEGRPRVKFTSAAEMLDFLDANAAG
jgi:ferredoxin/flavodoxin---NADP+ reductase